MTSSVSVIDKDNPPYENIINKALLSETKSCELAYIYFVHNYYLTVIIIHY